MDASQGPQKTPVDDRADILSHSLREAACAPLELAAAAFAGLGALFARPNVSARCANKPAPAIVVSIALPPICMCDHGHAWLPSMLPKQVSSTYH